MHEGKVAATRHVKSRVGRVQLLFVSRGSSST